MLLDLLFPDRCRGCGEGTTALCERCMGHGPRTLSLRGLDGGAAAADYSGLVRAVILEAKYRSRYRALDAFVARMVRCARGFGPSDVVVAPPAAREHMGQRGIDPGAYLAGRVARGLHVPLVSVFARSGPAQTGRARAERLRGPVVQMRRSVPPRVLIVDDVVTTGGTLQVAAESLRRVGAVVIVAVAAARVPERG